MLGISMISLVGVLILVLIFGFVFSKGAAVISWDFLWGDYHETVYDTYYDEGLDDTVFSRPEDLDDTIWFSSVWGVGFTDSVDEAGNAIILIVYVHQNSPLSSLLDKNEEGNFIAISNGQIINKVIFGDNIILYGSDGAKRAAFLFDQATIIKDMITVTSGGGIRGSIITTFLLVIMTLALAVPFGVFTAVYMHEFAPKKSKIVKLLRRLIEMLSGMPSIIFGLMGAAVFIPFTSAITSADGGNLFSGALTMTAIVLPLIIAATEEALSVVPDDFRQASLALGANKTQTTFKVVLRSSIPGILTGTLLAVGRIIGESAALIYAIGTAIKDKIILTERSTSLAVHIWSVMSQEVPNFEMASAISIIILLVVLILSLLVKLIAKKFIIDPSLR